MPIVFEKRLDDILNAKDLTDKTKNAYRNSVIRILKFAFPDEKLKLTNLVYKHAPIIKAIANDIFPLSTKVVILSACLCVSDKQQYRTELQKVNNCRNDELLEQVKSQKENDEWITNEEFILNNEAMEKRDWDDQKIMWNLLTLLPTRRLQCYCSMKVCEEKDRPDEKNCLVVVDGKFDRFEFYEFKNASRKPNELFDREFMGNLPNGENILKFLDKVSEVRLNGFLVGDRLPDTYGKFVSSVSMKWFGRKITNNTYRHMYASAFLSNMDMKLRLMVNVSKFMGHSLFVHLLYNRPEI